MFGKVASTRNEDITEHRTKWIRKKNAYCKMFVWVLFGRFDHTSLPKFSPPWTWPSSRVSLSMPRSSWSDQHIAPPTTKTTATSPSSNSRRHPRDGFLLPSYPTVTFTTTIVVHRPANPNLVPILDSHTGEEHVRPPCHLEPFPVVVGSPRRPAPSWVQNGACPHQPLLRDGLSKLSLSATLAEIDQWRPRSQEFERVRERESISYWNAFEKSGCVYGSQRTNRDRPKGERPPPHLPSTAMTPQQREKSGTSKLYW
jgi:hypothetical protein